MNRIRHIYIPAILFLIAISGTLRAQAWKVYPYTPDGSLVSFPVDEGWHPDEAIEWWYIAGHLEGTASGTLYSFMLTYFYYPGDTLGISYDGFRVLNLANDDTGEFHTETMPVRSYNDLATDHLHIDALLLNNVTEHWMHKEEPDGTLIPFEYELSATSDQGAIALSTVSQKPPLIPGDDGLFDQGADSYTYYYSLTENLVEGTLTFEGSSEEVTGSAWIDRQYGTFNPNTGEQYEWFYLQLSNGMDLNIWNLFTPENQLPDHPAYKHISVYVDSSTQYTSHDFKLERLSWAKMPVTENCYAQEWRLTSETDQLDLTFSTLHHNSEVEIPFNFFEGPTTASGTVNGTPVTGVGFAELVKSYEAPQIRITRPGKEWNRDFPIQWEVQNPDDGRPLLFDLEYSSTGEEPWSAIATEISDTLFYWNDHPFVNGDSCWFRVEGYTADKTLQGSAVSSVSARYDDQYTSIDQTDGVDMKRASPTIYPNPAGDMLWLHPSGEGYQSYSVSDLTGRLLLEGSLTGEGIHIGTLERGVYLFLLERPGLTSVQRFIKKR
ncbi:MAG: T9SS type A sorting domain-containing protein [Bacteroidales bacterium]|nr:T9SS type A sorting domain-containing protein [Bacteroidales bacterium]